ncbi:hypothetical protein Lal_00037394 [Lupinus albus]|nr:hypothetical protein Lal_00037394 [Lupinus albus]
MLRSVTSFDGPANGVRPYISSYMKIPKDHQSTALPCELPEATSELERVECVKGGSSSGDSTAGIASEQSERSKSDSMM